MTAHAKASWRALEPQRASWLDHLGRWSDKYADKLFPAPAVIAVILLMGFPVAYTAYLSLHKWFVSSLTPPTWVGLENYLALFRDQRFLQSVWHTAVFTTVAVVVQCVLGVAMALLFNQEFKGRGQVRTLFLLPMAATPVAIALVWMMLLDPGIGLINWLLKTVHLPQPLWTGDPKLVLFTLAMVDTWQWTPLVMLIVLAGLAALPKDPFEAALVDGATGWQTFWHVTLPMLRPSIIVAVLFRLIDALKTFDIIYIITGGGPGWASETINLFSFNQGFVYFHMGYASAVLMVLLAIVLTLSLVLIILRRAT
ncbi:MAG TPA: sugar ABC transporter permease [Firmicutes bacterium]|nr:sugar ABC transporter permease [Bacillota bacterium]